MTTDIKKDKDKDKDKDYKITVNGESKTVDHETLNFDEVVRLAYPQPTPDTIYSVMFEHAKEPKEGELVAGQSVTIKQNTEFDVDDTGRS
jgi:Multiubiquitin